MGNPGIVYQYIQMVTGLGNRMEDFPHSIRISNVTWNQCTCANLFNFLSGFFQCVKRAGTVQEDMIALSRESKAIARPMPREEPVTNAYFCVYSDIMTPGKMFLCITVEAKSTTSSYKYIFIFIIYWNY